MNGRPRLLLDLSAAFNQGAGIGRYARNLVGAAVPALNEIAEPRGWYAPEADAGDRFHALAADALGELAASSRRSPLSRRRIDQLWFRLPLGATSRLLAPGADIVYSPDFTAPPLRGVPRIVTVHDVAFLKTPKHCPAPLRRYLTAVVPDQVASATLVAVVSETTRRDVIQAYGVDEHRVTVIPNAADERFFSAAPPSAERRAALGLPDRYLLTVGTLEPRKNHLTVFEAARRVHRETGTPLVVVGRDGWQNAEVRSALTGLVSAGVAIDLTNLSDRDLSGVYAGAAAVLQLSWYEGFGIPVIEAMAAGAPVVASDIPAHREVAAGAATLVDPADADAAAVATLAVLRSDMPHDPTAGRAAARAYSWERSGTMLAKLLTEVMDGRGPDRRVPADPVRPVVPRAPA